MRRSTVPVLHVARPILRQELEQTVLYCTGCDNLNLEHSEVLPGLRSKPLSSMEVPTHRVRNMQDMLHKDQGH